MYNHRPPPIGVPSSINQLVDVLSSQSAQSVEVVRTLVNEFVEIIDMIMNDCSQVNIQNGKTWIMTNITTLSVLPPLLSFLLETSNNVSKFSQRLHLIYLMNDVLFHMDRLKFDWFKNEVNGWICKFVSNAVMMASNEEKGKIEKLLNIWSDKSYFPPETIQNLRSSIAKPSVPIPSHSMPPSGAIPHIHPSAPYARPPNFPPFPPPPMHPPPLHPPIPLHHPPHPSRPPMIPPQMGAIPPPGLFPPPPPHSGQLPMPPMPILPPVPIPGVNPPIPKQYHELPAGLMVPLVKPTSKPYTPIPTALIQLPSTRPNPTDELLSALDQFYEKIDVKLSKHGKNNVDDEKQINKKGDKKKGSIGVGDKENEGEVIDKYGFQVGFLDEWRKERAALKRQMERDRYEESRSSRDGRDRQSRSRGGRYHDDSDSESDSDSDRGSKKRSSRGRKRSKSRSRDNRRRRSVSSESSYSSRSRSSRSRSYSSSRSRSRSRSRSKPKSRSNKRYRSSSRSSYSSDSSYRHSKSRSRRIRRDRSRSRSRSHSRSRSRSRSLPRTGLGSGTGSSTADKAMIGYKLLQKSGWNPSAGSSSSKLGYLIESSAPRTMDTKYHGIGVGHSHNNNNNNNNEQSADVFDHFRKAKSYTFNRYTSDPNRVRTADTCFRCGQPGHFAKNCQSGLY